MLDKIKTISASILILLCSISKSYSVDNVEFLLQEYERLKSKKEQIINKRDNMSNNLAANLFTAFKSKEVQNINSELSLIEAKLNKPEIQKEIKQISANKNKQLCLQFGFQLETEGMADCILKLELEKERQATSKEQNYKIQKTINAEARRTSRQIDEIERKRRNERSMQRLDNYINNSLSTDCSIYSNGSSHGHIGRIRCN